MSPLIYSRKYKRNLPVLDVYAYIKVLIWPNPDTERAEAYRKELFGPSAVKGAPDEYYDMDYVVQYCQGDWQCWEDMPLDSKARLIAYSSLKNMADVISRHYEYMDDKIKKKPSGTS